MKFNKEDLLWEIESILEMRGYKSDIKKLRNFLKNNVKRRSDNKI
mgnify:CR=1 FL=1